LRKSSFTKTILLILALILIVGITALLVYNKTSNKTPKKVNVQILMNDGNQMTFELDPQYAPETVANFVNLAKAGFYNGLKFHRIIKGFMIQGGDPEGNGMGGSGKNIKGEFADNGFTKNTLKHVKGVISMARSEDMNSASSQFFIMDGSAPFLDGKYAAFGKLISGANTLDGIANTPVVMNSAGNEISTPTKDVIIKKIIVLDDVKK
jgi:peptidyl-prolyl cis-trans isomerase B (cyclophilin B)